MHSIFFVDNSRVNVDEDYVKFNQITKAQVLSEMDIFKSLGVESTCIDISEGSEFTIMNLLESI